MILSGLLFLIFIQQSHSQEQFLADEVRWYQPTMTDGGYFTCSMAYDWTATQSYSMNCGAYRFLYRFNTNRGYGGDVSNQFVFSYSNSPSICTNQCEKNLVDYPMPRLTTAAATGKSWTKTNTVVTVAGLQCTVYDPNPNSDWKDGPVRYLSIQDGVWTRVCHVEMKDGSKIEFIKFALQQGIIPANQVRMPPSCTACSIKMDLALVYDRSGSIKYGPWKEVMRATKSLINKLPFNNDNGDVRVSITTFGEANDGTNNNLIFRYLMQKQQDVVVALDELSGDCIQKSDDGVHCQIGVTPISTGMILAAQTIRRDRRFRPEAAERGQAKVMIVFTDGVHNELADGVTFKTRSYEMEACEERGPNIPQFRRGEIYSFKNCGDSDENGVPDAWENKPFTSLSLANAQRDLIGAREYVRYVVPKIKIHAIGMGQTFNYLPGNVELLIISGNRFPSVPISDLKFAEDGNVPGTTPPKPYGARIKEPLPRGEATFPAAIMLAPSWRPCLDARGQGWVVRGRPNCFEPDNVKPPRVFTAQWGGLERVLLDEVREQLCDTSNDPLKDCPDECCGGCVCGSCVSVSGCTSDNACKVKEVTNLCCKSRMIDSCPVTPPNVCLKSVCDSTANDGKGNCTFEPISVPCAVRGCAVPECDPVTKNTCAYKPDKNFNKGTYCDPYICELSTGRRIPGPKPCPVQSVGSCQEYKCVEPTPTSPGKCDGPNQKQPIEKGPGGIPNGCFTPVCKDSTIPGQPPTFEWKNISDTNCPPKPCKTNVCVRTNSPPYWTCKEDPLNCSTPGDRCDITKCDPKTGKCPEAKTYRTCPSSTTGCLVNCRCDPKNPSDDPCRCDKKNCTKPTRQCEKNECDDRFNGGDCKRDTSLCDVACTEDCSWRNTKCFRFRCNLTLAQLDLNYLQNCLIREAVDLSTVCTDPCRKPTNCIDDPASPGGYRCVYENPIPCSARPSPGPCLTYAARGSCCDPVNVTCQDTGTPCVVNECVVENGVGICKTRSVCPSVFPGEPCKVGLCQRSGGRAQCINETTAGCVNCPDAKPADPPCQQYVCIGDKWEPRDLNCSSYEDLLETVRKDPCREVFCDKRIPGSKCTTRIRTCETYNPCFPRVCSNVTKKCEFTEEVKCPNDDLCQECKCTAPNATCVCRNRTDICNEVDTTRPCRQRKCVKGQCIWDDSECKICEKSCDDVNKNNACFKFECDPDLFKTDPTKLNNCDRVIQTPATICTDHKGDNCFYPATCENTTGCDYKPVICNAPLFPCNESYKDPADPNCCKERPKDCTANTDQCNLPRCNITTGKCYTERRNCTATRPCTIPLCDPFNGCIERDIPNCIACPAVPTIQARNKCEKIRCDFTTGTWIRIDLNDECPPTISKCRPIRCDEENGGCREFPVICRNISDACNVTECDRSTGKCPAQEAQRKLECEPKKPCQLCYCDPASGCKCDTRDCEKERPPTIPNCTKMYCDPTVAPWGECKTNRDACPCVGYSCSHLSNNCFLYECDVSKSTNNCDKVTALAPTLCTKKPNPCLLTPICLNDTGCQDVRMTCPKPPPCYTYVQNENDLRCCVLTPFNCTQHDSDCTRGVCNEEKNACQVEKLCQSTSADRCTKNTCTPGAASPCTEVVDDDCATGVCPPPGNDTCKTYICDPENRKNIEVDKCSLLAQDPCRPLVCDPRDGSCIEKPINCTNSSDACDVRVCVNGKCERRSRRECKSDDPCKVCTCDPIKGCDNCVPKCTPDPNKPCVRMNCVGPQGLCVPDSSNCPCESAGCDRKSNECVKYECDLNVTDPARINNCDKVTNLTNIVCAGYISNKCLTNHRCVPGVGCDFDRIDCLARTPACQRLVGIDRNREECCIFEPVNCENFADTCNTAECNEGLNKCVQKPKCNITNTPCKKEGCNATTGQCYSTPPDPNCEDTCPPPPAPEPCVILECPNGTWTRRPQPCVESGDPCNPVVCKPELGKCVAVPVVCNASSSKCETVKCVSGRCVTEQIPCSSSKPCETCSCTPTEGCKCGTLDCSNFPRKYNCSTVRCENGACQEFTSSCPCLFAKCEEKSSFCERRECDPANPDPLNCDKRTDLTISKCALHLTDKCKINPQCRPEVGNCTYDDVPCPELPCKTFAGRDPTRTGCCVYRPVTCNVSSVCNVSKCNENTNQCEESPKCTASASSLCVEVKCAADGTCVETTKNLTDACPTTDKCSIPIACEEKSCKFEDKCAKLGNKCYTPKCLDGVCSLEKVLCTNGGNVCLEVSCDNSTGCITTEKDCKNFSTKCGIGICDGTVAGGCKTKNFNATQACDDKNQCTLDYCDPKDGCKNVPIDIDIMCDDADLPDDNPCYKRKCDPIVGCKVEQVVCLILADGSVVEREEGVNYTLKEFKSDDCTTVQCVPKNSTDETGDANDGYTHYYNTTYSNVTKPYKCVKQVRVCLLFGVKEYIAVGIGAAIIAGIVIAIIACLACSGGAAAAVYNGANIHGISKLHSNPLYKPDGSQHDNLLYKPMGFDKL